MRYFALHKTLDQQPAAAPSLPLLVRSARGFGDASRGAFARCYLTKCVLAAGADRGVLAALRDDVAGGDGPAVAWILKASGGEAPV